MRRLLAALFFVPALLMAQEEPAPATEPEAPRIVAAAWCAVYLEDPEEGSIGCDYGVGAALWRRGRVSFAGVVGQRSVGFGLVWTMTPGDGVVVAAGLGLVAPYDGLGIRADGAELALGCTFGFNGGDR